MAAARDRPPPALVHPTFGSSSSLPSSVGLTGALIKRLQNCHPRACPGETRLSFASCLAREGRQAMESAAGPVARHTSALACLARSLLTSIYTRSTMADSSSLFSAATSQRHLLDDDDDNSSLKTERPASVYTAATVGGSGAEDDALLQPFDPPLGIFPHRRYVRGEVTVLEYAEAKSSISGCVLFKRFEMQGCS